MVLELNHDQAGLEEKVNVTAIDLNTNILTIQRGRWGTSAKAHASGAAIREIGMFGTERTVPTGVVMGKNPLDIIRELYRYAGIDDTDIDNTKFDSERDTWLLSSVTPATGAQSGVLFERILTEQKKVEDLIKEIRELVMLLVWIDEDQKITVNFDRDLSKLLRGGITL